jgi:hypothetical protein
MAVITFEPRALRVCFTYSQDPRGAGVQAERRGCAGDRPQ